MTPNVRDVGPASEATTCATHSPMVNDRSEWYCIAYHALMVVGYVVAVIVYRIPRPMPERVAFVTAAVLLLGLTSGVGLVIVFHNHMHRPFFRSPAANRWYGRTVPVFAGWSGYLLCQSHIVVHHAHTMDDRDWTVPRRRADGTPESLFRYALASWPWRAVRCVLAEMRRDDYDGAVRREAVGEVVIFALLWSIPFVVDVRMALLLWLAPQWVANVVLFAGGTYAQHAGCSPMSSQSVHGHSVSSSSRFDLVTMFNNGHHTVHHEMPRLHWTDLPEVQFRRAGVFTSDGGIVRTEGYFELASAQARRELRGGPSRGGSARVVRTVAHVDSEALRRQLARSVSHPADRWWSRAQAAAVGVPVTRFSGRHSATPLRGITMIGRCTFPLVTIGVLAIGAVQPVAAAFAAVAFYVACKRWG